MPELIVKNKAAARNSTGNGVIREEEPVDLSLTQIVQLGKSRQREIQQNRKIVGLSVSRAEKRSTSLGTTMTRSKPVEILEEPDEEVNQTNLTIGTVLP